MYKRILVFGVVIIGLATALVRAQDVIGTSVKSAVITGTFVTATPLNTGTGACELSGYAGECPSGGVPTKCLCFKATGAKLSGSMAGSGTADVEVTVDDSNSTAPSPGPGCSPMYGVATLNGTTGVGKNKKAKVITENLALVGCHHISGSSPDTVSGGFGINGPASPTPTPSGWGTVNGSFERSTGAAKLVLKGSVTESH